MPFYPRVKFRGVVPHALSRLDEYVPRTRVEPPKISLQCLPSQSENVRSTGWREQSLLLHRATVRGDAREFHQEHAKRFVYRRSASSRAVSISTCLPTRARCIMHVPGSTTEAISGDWASSTKSVRSTNRLSSDF